jgi:hypothetical protein
VFYLFELVFLLGAAAVAFWLDARFPRLAPRTLIGRMAAALAATFLLRAAPVDAGSRAAFLASLFGAVFPALVFSLLSALWLLRLLRDLRASA